MVKIKVDNNGWVHNLPPYFLKDDDSLVEYDISEEEFYKLTSNIVDFWWKYKDGSLVQERYRQTIYSEEDRLQERTRLHKATDQDYAKYARQVRCNVDMPHSQEVLDYIDSYNLQVSNTVNEVGFPQNVTYPEYNLP